MPVRVKPVIQLPPCTLTLENIKSIVALAEREFDSVEYCADDDFWEIFDEPSDEFIKHIAQRDKLDGLKIVGKTSLQGLSKEVTLLFNRKTAEIRCNLSHEELDWVEHFELDLKKHIDKQSSPNGFFSPHPVAAARRAYVWSKLTMDILPYSFFIEDLDYCKIIIKPAPPNPLLESLKQSFIYDILKTIALLVIGGLITAFGIPVLVNFWASISSTF